MTISALNKAKIAVDGMPKDVNLGYSTFFSDTMSPQDVIDSINEAYANRTLLPQADNAFVGLAVNGMEIMIFIDNRGKIISAFPYS